MANQLDHLIVFNFSNLFSILQPCAKQVMVLSKHFESAVLIGVHTFPKRAFHENKRSAESTESESEFQPRYQPQCDFSLKVF